MSAATAAPKRMLHKNTWSGKPDDKLGHSEVVNKCLATVLAHGYEVTMGAQDVVYLPEEDALEYVAQAPLKQTIAATGTYNPGYPEPWDTLRAPKDHVETPCACGRMIGGWPECDQAQGWCKNECDCRTRKGRDLIHQCAILGCRVRTCNSMHCPEKHYKEAHGSLRLLA